MEVRQARTEREHSAREVVSLRRQLQLLLADKEAFQAAAASDAAYIRRLESRVAAAEPEKRVAERQKAAEATAEVTSLRTALQVAEAQATAAAAEVRQLQAALEQRAEEWSAGGDGSALPALLLRTVAASREESVRLAQVAAERGDAARRAEAAAASTMAQAQALAASEASLAQQLQTTRLALGAAQRAAQV